MSQGYIQEAIYQILYLYLPWNCSISYVSPEGVIMESKRTLVVPERSLDGF
jgi:hypothetical protein